MKKFLIKLAVFILPLILFALFILMTDPFRLFFYYDDYYKNNFIYPNREMVCLKTYNAHRNELKFDSFIFGSSRSQAFKTKDWMKFLPKGSSAFHFDATAEGLYGIYNKLRYIDDHGDQIRNVLMIVDGSTMGVTSDRKGHLAISPPELSRGSNLDYYMTFLNDIFDFRFVTGYTDYYFFRTYRPYMKWLFNNPLYEMTPDNLTCDVYYSYDKMIAEDQTAYYQKLLKDGTFYARSKMVIAKTKITDCEKDLLKKIQQILAKHNSDFKIVISPTYDQIQFDRERLQLLYSLFDKERVFDFSGQNEFTNSIYNYYDNSHYRKEVADKILEIIYNTAKDSVENKSVTNK